jgi:PEP-CTERM/exosortase A-associated glycosyltransferase
MKILHVLETSVPNTVGYTIRSREIVTHQRRMGLDPVVVTSPLFAAPHGAASVEEFDGTRYYRTNHIRVPASARYKWLSYKLRLQMLSRYRRAVLEIASREKPDLIHAHSSYTNAYGALPAARSLGVPLVYEVRTLWGESAVIENGWRPGSLKYRFLWGLELGAMRRAHCVVPIAQGIRDELMARGIDPRKMRIVPNGVDTGRFVPQPRDEALAESSGLAGRFVVGFIGSILRLEGLSTLLDAYALCLGRSSGLGLVIVGDGPERSALEAQAARLGVKVVFTGRVPHDSVASWYSIMDLLVYPRIRAVITERVTPLKPLEAMAQGKVCVGSDVGGITELIEHDKTGVIFRSEDPQSLATAILGLRGDPARMARLRQNALEFVRLERDWHIVVRRYGDLYCELLNAPAGELLRQTAQ